MRVDRTIIENLKPCKSRLTAYLENYAEFEGTLLDFLCLDKITPQDKMWVAFRLLPQKQVVEIACRIAESVLHLYEEQYPGDLRPRKAIEAARSGDKDAAADAAATYATYAAYAAYAAAYVAVHAAARAATHAARAAADATAYVAVHAAATHAAATHAAATHATHAAATHAARAAADATAYVAVHAAHIEIIKAVYSEMQYV